MAIRNSQEVGECLLKIVNLLATNQRLLRLLKYTDENPFSKDHEDLKSNDILHDNIKIVPLVNESEDTTESTVVVTINSGRVEPENKEFKDFYFSALVYVPLDKWLLNDINLRPFLIMSEVEKKLKDIRVESIGKIKYHGFELQTITDLMSCYRMEFTIEDVYN